MHLSSISDNFRHLCAYFLINPTPSGFHLKNSLLKFAHHFLNCRDLDITFGEVHNFFSGLHINAAAETDSFHVR